MLCVELKRMNHKYIEKERSCFKKPENLFKLSPKTKTNKQKNNKNEQGEVFI